MWIGANQRAAKRPRRTVLDSLRLIHDLQRDGLADDLPAAEVLTRTIRLGVALVKARQALTNGSRQVRARPGMRQRR